jgi:hypothetical protein
MSETYDPIPVRALERPPLRVLDFNVEIETRRGTIELTRRELFDVAAAIELDRVLDADLDRLFERKASRLAWTWAALVDGANGLQPDDAPGTITVRAVFERLEVSVATWRAARRLDERVDEPRARRRSK